MRRGWINTYIFIHYIPQLETVFTIVDKILVLHKSFSCKHIVIFLVLICFIHFI